MQPHTDDEETTYYASEEEQESTPSENFVTIMEKLRQKDLLFLKQNSKPKKVKVDKYAHLKKQDESGKVDAIPEAKAVVMNSPDEIDNFLAEMLQKKSYKTKRNVSVTADALRQLERDEYEENELNKVDVGKVSNK